MKFSIRDIQARLHALGFDPGPVDGLNGRKTKAALNEALSECGASGVEGLFHPSGIRRMVLHWTAGARGVIDLERRAYNGVIDHDGIFHKGKWSPEDQAHYKPGVRGASHTRMSNTGVIGLAMDCMSGAVERPFSWGHAPMNEKQLQGIVKQAAIWAQKYDLPVRRTSILTHAEVQPTLGIRQKFKWDITILPDMERPGDPVKVGDRLRNMIEAAL